MVGLAYNIQELSPDFGEIHVVERLRDFAPLY